MQRDASVEGDANMEYRVVGRSGVRVSTLCLGAMSMGAIGNQDRDECVRMIREALNAGVNTVDTADVYSRGDSEEIVGAALAALGSRASEVVVATKCYWPMGPGPNDQGLSRRHIVRAVDASLRRLGTERVDILYLHKPDAATDIAESLAAVSDLVHAGKVTMIGTSSHPADLLVEAQWVAERRGLERPVVEQPAYSILARAAEGDVLPVCQRYGVGVMAAAPLNGGWLAGARRPGQPPESGSRVNRWPGGKVDESSAAAQNKTLAVEKLSSLAAEAGLSLTALALGFVRAHPAVASAVVGPRTPAHLDAMLAAADVGLDDDLLDQIDDIVSPGIDVDPADRWYRPPALARSARRQGPRHHV
jgi:aryl-alcohol dehydrogenase-like predicted oxidoreductase